MAKITTEQKDFLARHDIPLDRLFDATGIQRQDYKRTMIALGKWVAIGVTPCAEAGHTMRTSAGHCAQCRPSNLGFLRRYDTPGEVYVVHSKSGALTKVGSAKNADERVRSLNTSHYGGVSDWKIEFCEATSAAGRIESVAQQALVKYSALGTYVNSGMNTQCREIFSCSVRVAVKTVRQAMATKA